MKDLKDILSHFFLAGKILEIKPLGAGLINDSYKVTPVAPDTPDYVLQRINHSISKMWICCKIIFTKSRLISATN